MPHLPTPVLPKQNLLAAHPPSAAIEVSPGLLAAAASDPDAVLQKLQTSTAGLSSDEADQFVTQYQ